MNRMQMDSFTVSGFTVRTTNKNEMDPAKAKIGALWQDFFRQFAPTGSQPTVGYGVYSSYASDENGEFAVTAGIRGEFPAEQAQNVTIPAGTYLRFAKRGPLPGAALELWQEIWTYFQEKDAPWRTFQYDFEEYLAMDEVAIYIGVKEKA